MELLKAISFYLNPLGVDWLNYYTITISSSSREASH